MTKQTSKDAYREILESGLLNLACLAVATRLAEDGPLTGNEVDRALNSPSAHKRLSDLARWGVAKVVGVKQDPLTGKHGEVWSLISGARPVRPASTASIPKTAALEPASAPLPAEPVTDALPDQDALQAVLTRLRAAQAEVRAAMTKAAQARTPLTATERAVERLLRSG